MKLLVWLFLSVFFLSLAWSQNLPGPLQETVTDPQEIVALMQGAQSTIFLATPLTSQALEQELISAVSRGVTVYLITPGDNPNARALANANVQVRTLDTFAEGLLLIDKATLIVGGLLSGSDADTLKVDVSLYGETALQQLRPVWQLAQPFGG